MEEIKNELGEKADDIEEIKKLIQKEVDRINKPQPHFKKINKVIIKMDDFEKTTTKKIKRYNESNKEGND